MNLLEPDLSEYLETFLKQIKGVPKHIKRNLKQISEKDIKVSSKISIKTKMFMIF